MWKLRMPGPCRPSISLQRPDEEVQPLEVVLRPEVVEAGLGPGLVVQDADVERAVGGHQVHEGPDLLDLGRELRDLEVVD